MLPNKFYLNELRARKGLTQAEVAKDLGISVPTYNAWEKDFSKVTISKAIAIAKYFGCSIEQIFLKR